MQLGQPVSEDGIMRINAFAKECGDLLGDSSGVFNTSKQASHFDGYIKSKMSEFGPGRIYGSPAAKPLLPVGALVKQTNFPKCGRTIRGSNTNFKV
jgi:hypothetical protein